MGIQQRLGLLVVFEGGLVEGFVFFVGNGLRITANSAVSDAVISEERFDLPHPHRWFIIDTLPR